MTITVPVIKTDMGGIYFYKPDYVGDYKVIAYSDDKLTVQIEVEGD
jgi:hypothetical protein